MSDEGQEKSFEDKGSDEQSESSKGGEDTLKLSTDEMVKRRSRWQSSLAALRYVYSVSKDEDVQVRDSDRATTWALLIMCVLALISLMVQQPVVAMHRGPFVISADVLVGLALIMYVCNRFGILTALTPRQALICYQLMLGASLLGIFLAINLGLISGYVVCHTPHISIMGGAHP